MNIRSPWATTTEAAEHLRFKHDDGSPDPHSCLKFLKKKGVEMKKRGHTVLVRRDQLDGTLTDMKTRVPRGGRSRIGAGAPRSLETERQGLDAHRA